MPKGFPHRALDVTPSCWSKFRGAHQENQRDGALVLSGMAERIGVGQAGEKKALG